jgi:hypothetical protein
MAINAPRLISLAVTLALLIAARTSAQSAPRANTEAPRSTRVEVWGAVTRMVAAPAGDVVSAYSPPLFFATDFTSSGGQTLTLDGSGGLGFQGGVNIFGSAHVGAQILVDRASADLSGANPPYTAALTYVSRPPNSPPQVVGTRQFVVWPDTTGSLVQTTIGLNGAVRAGSARTVNVTVSGGLAVYRVSGATQPLGFTAFRLGGHSVLFSDEYRVGVSLGPETTVGFDIGAEVNLPVGRRSAVVIGYRYLGGPSVDVPVTPATIPPIKSSTRCRSPRCRGSSCPVRRMSASPRRAS